MTRVRPIRISHLWSLALRLHAPVIALGRRPRARLGPLLLIGLMIVGRSASAQNKESHFDMPAMQLTKALVEFADKTGMAVLVDGEWAKDLQSSPVKGRLLPSEAARILIAGTGLSIRFAGDSAFTVGLMKPALRDADARPALRPSATHDAYFLTLQNSLEQAICASADLRSNLDRLAFQVWIGEAGRILAVHFLGPAGEGAGPTMLTEIMAATRVATPPRDLPQPVTIVLQATSKALLCAPVPVRVHD